MLFGALTLGVSPLLGLFGIFLTLYSIGNILTITFLATGKTKIWVVPVICALFQIIGISQFHQSLLQVIYINIGISTLLVLGLGAYYLKQVYEKA